MTQELRERVIKEMLAHGGYTSSLPDRWSRMADAAIALVLEEAAKVAAKVAEASFGEGYHIATAIRALKNNGE